MMKKCKEFVVIGLFALLPATAWCGYSMNHPLANTSIPSSGADGSGNTPSGGEAVILVIRKANGEINQQAEGAAESFGGWYLDLPTLAGSGQKAELYGEGVLRVTHTGITVSSGI